MRLADKSGIAGVLYVLALAVLLSGLVSATDAVSTGDNERTDQNVYPGSGGNDAFGFEILYGGDMNISGSADPGTSVYSFEENSTMFLDQSDTDTGLNGYADGEDIINVVREHVGDEASVLNGTPIANFSEDVYFSDGGVANNSVFDGNNSTEGFSGEAIIKTSSGLLDTGAEVLAAGNVSTGDFSGDMKFIDSDNGGAFEGGVYGDDVLIKSLDSTLDDGDEIIPLEGALTLDDFSDDTTRFLRKNGSQESFVAESAIVIETGDNDNILERDSDQVVKDGAADIAGAESTGLLYSDQGDNSFTEDMDSIYYSQDGNSYVNESDIRLGDYKVSSRPNSADVSLGLDLLSRMNDSNGAPETNDIGKSLSTYDSGSFLLLEYGSPTNSWSPENSDDQDVIVYDVENDGLSEGDVLVYNQDPDNGTVEASVGEEFTQSDMDDTDSPDNTLTVSTELGFNDTDENQDYTAGDQVVLNVSESTSGVVLAPNDEAGDLISHEFNDTLGNISRWDVDTSSDNITEDGFYVAMNETGTVSTGDVRLGHWTSEEASGSVGLESLDRGADLNFFESFDNIGVLDADHDGEYDAGEGGLSDFNGREAIISTDDSFLNSSDSIIREGRMPSSEFDSDMGYIDDNGDGSFDDGEAIAEASNREFDNDSEVIVPGDGNISSISGELRFIETGEEGFDPGKDPVFHDGEQDGVLDQGSLDLNDGESSLDYVFAPREGNLQNFNRTFNETGYSKTVFLDSDEDEAYDSGEDVVEIELVTNGSNSDSFDGVEIFNFADSTRHTSESYSDGETIVNDTDMNGVYQNVLEGLTVNNIIDISNSEEFFREASDTALDSGIDVYRGTEYTEENLVGTLTWNSGQWTSPDFSEEIKSDTVFSLAFDAAPSGELNDRVYGFRGEASDIAMAGDSLGPVESVDRQFIDAHAPEFVDAWTGKSYGGNSSARDKVFVETNEVYSGLADGDLYPGLFAFSKDLEVIGIGLKDQNNLELTLNDTVETNETFEVRIAEDQTLQDRASNGRDQSSTDAKDGLKPELESQAYRDSDEDGQIDQVVLNFSEKVYYSAFSSDDWNVTEQQLSGLSVNDGTVSQKDTLTLEASADENITGVSDNEPFLDYENDVISDGSGNDLSAFNETLLDRAAPVIMNATTDDENSDSLIDTVKLRFTEPLDNEASELVSESFNVSDAEVTDVESVSGLENLSLEVDSELSTSTNPSVTVFNNTIFDPALNAIDEDQEFNGVIDNARPVLLNAQINADKSSYSSTFVDLRFSEPVKPVTGGEREEEVNLSGKGLKFKNSDSNNLRTVEYGEILPTGDHPNISGIENITDGNGNPAALEASENVTVNSFRKQMMEGWNFVSFPIADESTYEISKMIEASKIDVIWTYRDSEWQTYDPGAAQNDFEHFEGGVGYMIQASEDFVLNPNVNTARPEEATGEELVDASIQLEGGYNLVGPFQEFDVTAGSPGAFGAIEEENVGKVYAQSDDGSGSIDIGNPIRSSDGANPGVMNAVEAYWMNWQSGSAVTYSEPQP